MIKLNAEKCHIEVTSPSDRATSHKWQSKQFTGTVTGHYGNSHRSLAELCSCADPSMHSGLSVLQHFLGWSRYMLIVICIVNFTVINNLI